MNFIDKQKQNLKSYISAKLFMVVLFGITLWQIAVQHYVEVVALICMMYFFYLLKEKYKRLMLVEVD